MKGMINNPFWMGVVGGMLIVLLLGVGGSDYAQAKKDHVEYCQNVRDGVWPDYQKNFKESCKNIVDTKTE